MNTYGYVEVVGHIWQPGIGTCAQRIELRPYDLENILAERITGDVPVTDETLAAGFTRDAVEQWLCTNAGDFQSIDDFYATAGSVEIPWASEDSEMSFVDAMYGEEDA